MPTQGTRHALGVGIVANHINTKGCEFFSQSPVPHNRSPTQKWGSRIPPIPQAVGSTVRRIPSDQGLSGTQQFPNGTMLATLWLFSVTSYMLRRIRAASSPVITGPPRVGRT